MEKFKYASAIDLSMGYYHIPVDEATQKLTTTTIGDRQFSYQRLAMGISCAPDIFQSIMTNIFADLDYVHIYIDNILILQEWDEPDDVHFEKLKIVLG